MKKTALLCVFTVLTIFPLFADVVFLQGDLKTAKARAAREGKLILLDFWANYCTPCKMMEEYTFTNPEVEDYINAHYIPVKVDIQSFDGYDLKNQFKVSLLPTIIVLNSKGIQVGRHEETFSATRLIPVLEQYNQSKNRLKAPVATEDFAYRNKPTSSNTPIRVASAHISKPSTIAPTRPVSTPNKVPNKPDATVRIPYSVEKSENLTPQPVKVTPAKLAVEGAVATSVESKTFSIQVCAYFSEDNVREAMPEIKESYGKKGRIFVSKRAENGKTIYRVLVGSFDTKQEADKFMKSNRIAGLVKDLNSLK